MAGCQPSPEDLWRRAQEATAAGDAREAAIHLKGYLQARPDDGAARAALGRVAFTLGDAAAAEKEFRRALQLGEPAGVIGPALAEALLAQGQFQAALDALGPSAGDPGGDYRMAMLAGRALAGLARMDDAEAMYRRAMVAAPDQVAPPVALADLLINAGRAAEADPLIAGALALDPGSIAAMLLRARRMADEQGLQVAAAYLREVLPKARSSLERVDVLARLVDAELTLENLDAARQGLGQLEAVAASDVLTRYLRARLQAQSGDYTAAVLTLQKILVDAPDYRPAERLIGTVQYLSGNLEQAAVHIGRLLARGPPDPFLARLLAELRLQQDRPELALQTLLPMMRQGPAAVFDQRMLVLAGQASLRLGDAEAALAYFRSGSSQDPGNERFRLGEISARLASGDVEAARTMLEGLRASSSNRLAVDYLSVVAHLVQRQYDAADDLAGRLLRENGDAAWSHLLMAAVQLAQGREDAARGQFEAVLRLEPGNREAQINLARLDFQAGDLASGEKRLGGLIAADPADMRPRLLLGEAQLAASLVEPALRQARELVRNNPDSAPALNFLGRAAAAAGRWDEARESFNRITALDPRNARAWLNLARATVAGGQRDGLPEGLRRAMQIAPADPAVLLTAGELLAELGQPDEAQGYFRRAYAAAPGSEIAMRACRAGLQARRPDACGMLDDWLRSNPGDVPARLFRASTHQSRGEKAAAITQYESVIAADPAQAVALNNLAWLYAEIGDARALAIGRRALAARPDFAPAMDTLGWIELRQGNKARGLELITAAAEQMPADPDVRYRLAYAQAENGDGQRALRTVSELLSSTPTFENRQAAEQLMRRLTQTMAGAEG